MAPQEALKTLGLKPTATPEEIRQAYRDLVKVWHPDRFGTDARLRAKAEDHLKEINKAFDLLEASDFRTDAEYAAPFEPEPQPAPWQTRASRDRVARGWLYLGSLVLIAAVMGFAIHQIGTNPVRSSAPLVQEHPSSSEQTTAPKALHRPQPHQPQSAPAGTPNFKVWSLSQPDTDRLQLACARHTPGSEAYRECVAAQLDAITQRRGAPDMTGMSTGERDAAEAACRGARNATDAAYARCLRQQVAELAAEPIRPDLSSFSSADRESIRTACSAASRRGAAEYDRCVGRFARTLSDAEPASSATP